jgi:hypothetical protein
VIRVALDAGHWEIWSEPELGDVAVGRCLGAGDTLDAAKAEARKELEQDRAGVDALLPDMPVCWDCGTPLRFDAQGKAEKPCGHGGVLVVPAVYWLERQKFETFLSGKP